MLKYFSVSSHILYPQIKNLRTSALFSNAYAYACFPLSHFRNMRSASFSRKYPSERLWGEALKISFAFLITKSLSVVNPNYIFNLLSFYIYKGKQIHVSDRGINLDESLGGDMMYVKAVCGLDGCSSKFPCFRCRKSKENFCESEIAAGHPRSLAESSVFIKKSKTRR